MRRFPNDRHPQGLSPRGRDCPRPAKIMRGWCKTTSAVIFGQLLSGMARLGRATGDRSLWDKAERAVRRAGARRCRPDGNVRMRPYDWEKLVCGLVDLHRYAGSTTALPILEADHRMGGAHLRPHAAALGQFRLLGRGPGANAGVVHAARESLSRLPRRPAITAFKDFADVWLYDDYWRPLRGRAANCRRSFPVHAYSHVNSFSQRRDGLSR